jgi:uncharacterized protein YjdB
MRLTWALAAFCGVLIVLMALPAADAQVGTRLYLPVVPDDATPTPSPTPTGVRIRYRAYSSGLGWLDWQNDQGTAGVLGQSRPIEAIQMQLVNAPPGANLRYRVHLAFQGWQEWVNTGDVAGKPGEGLQIEAIEIGLDNAPGSFISSEVHVRDWGWLGPVRDYWIAGAIYQQRRVEAFRAYVRTGSPEPARVRVAYSVDLQDGGWTDWYKDDEIAGTIGQQRRIEAMRVMLFNKPEFMDVEYIVNLEGLSWGAWTHDAGIAGMPDGNRSILAFEMRLISAYPGSAVIYQGHIQNRGWVGPVASGPIGRPEDGLRLEAMRVVIGHSQP